MKRSVPVLFLLAVFPITVFAQDGGYAGAELRIGLGARAVALGEAFGAVADDGSASFFNPAGAAWIEKKMFSASYRVLEFDRRQGYLSLIFPLQKDAGLGFFWVHSSIGEITGRDDIGQPTGELNDHQNLFGVNFGKRFTKRFSLGANIKYLQKVVAGVSAYTVAFDLGTQYKFKNFRMGNTTIPLAGLKIGAAVENIFARLQFNSNEYYGQFGSPGNTTTDTLPLNFRAGTSYLYREQVLVTLDVEKNNKQKAFFHAGGEYTFRKILALRAGYSHGQVAFGLGIRQPISPKQALRLDYAFKASPISERGDHLFSLQFEF
ncbi:MAG: PorV/PorQ family protein [candidate division Zixibacteria bacterium]|nr:PorV/PorQ family protein [candidate division Zixibacteria bacterium]